MKWLKSARDWIGFLVTLSGAIMLGDAITGWLNLFNWTAEQVREPLVQTLRIGWSVVFATCVMWSAFVCLRWMAGVAPLGYRALVSFVFWLKRTVGMGEFLTKGEALKTIRESPFFKIRQKIDVDWIGASAVVNALRGGPTYRDQIIKDRFARKILREFEGVDGSYAEASGYRAERLEEWLEALLDAEVDDEMGQLPKPYMPPFKDPS